MARLVPYLALEAYHKEVGLLPALPFGALTHPVQAASELLSAARERGGGAAAVEDLREIGLAPAAAAMLLRPTSDAGARLLAVRLLATLLPDPAALAPAARPTTLRQLTRALAAVFQVHPLLLPFAADCSP